jgi:hypothetical protein
VTIKLVIAIATMETTKNPLPLPLPLPHPHPHPHPHPLPHAISVSSTPLSPSSPSYSPSSPSYSPSSPSYFPRCCGKSGTCEGQVTQGFCEACYHALSVSNDAIDNQKVETAAFIKKQKERDKEIVEATKDTEKCLFEVQQMQKEIESSELKLEGCYTLLREKNLTIDELKRSDRSPQKEEKGHGGRGWGQGGRGQERRGQGRRDQGQERGGQGRRDQGQERGGHEIQLEKEVDRLTNILYKRDSFIAHLEQQLKKEAQRVQETKKIVSDLTKSLETKDKDIENLKNQLEKASMRNHSSCPSRSTLLASLICWSLPIPFKMKGTTATYLRSRMNSSRMAKRTKSRSWKRFMKSRTKKGKIPRLRKILQQNPRVSLPSLCRNTRIVFFSLETQSLTRKS